MHYGERWPPKRQRKSLRHYTRAYSGFWRESGLISCGWVNEAVKRRPPQSI
jgi:hypothetical protein